MNALENNGLGPVFELESLLGRCLGNMRLVERVLATFENQFTHDFAELERIVLAGESPRVAEVAHRMKGASASVGANSLCQCVSSIEELAREQRMGEVHLRMQQLRGEWAWVSQRLHTLGA